MITIRTGMTIGGTSQEPISSTFLMPGGKSRLRGAMLKLDKGDEKRSIVERLLGEAKRDLALDGLEKTAIAAGIGTTTAPHVPRATGTTTYLSNGGAVEHAQEMAAHDEAVRLHQGTAYQELMCIKGKTVRSWSGFAKGRSE